MSFASFPVDQLGLPTEQLRQCERAQLATAADILLPSQAELARRLRATCSSANDAARALIAAATRALMPASRRASALPTPDDVRIEGSPFACRVGAVTELVGESAAGKSHLAMALAVGAQIPALSTRTGGCLMLTSERPLVTSRLVEIASAMLARHPGPPLPEVLDNIQASSVHDVESLEHALTYVVPAVLARWREGDGSALMGQDAAPSASRSTSADAGLSDSNGDSGVPLPRRRRTRRPVRVLLVDSLAALFRGEGGPTGGALAQRSRHLCFLADKLKALALEFAVAVVVVNQVSDVFARATDAAAPAMTYATQARFFDGQSALVRKEASLGVVWANCVNTRIMLGRTGRRRVVTLKDLRADTGTTSASGTRTQEERGGDGRKRKRDDEASQEELPGVALNDGPTLVRRMHQVFSAFGPPGTADYVLTPSGVHVLPGSYKVSDLGPALRRRAAQAARADADADEEPTTQQAAEEGQYPVPAEFWDEDPLEGEEGLAVGVVD